jgi:pilus assembly protein CpaC
MLRPLPQILVAVAVVLGSAPSFADEDASTISLGLGIQKVINVPNIARIALGNPDVADVRPLGQNQVILLGKAEGRTTLLVWKASGARLSYLLNVTKKDADKVIEEIKELLRDPEGITLRKIGDRIYMEGYAYTDEDAERVQAVTRLYGQVTSFVKIAPGAKRRLAADMNAALQRAGLRNARAVLVGSTIFLEGSVDSKEELDQAERIVKAMGAK